MLHGKDEFIAVDGNRHDTHSALTKFFNIFVADAVAHHRHDLFARFLHGLTIVKLALEVERNRNLAALRVNLNALRGCGLSRSQFCGFALRDGLAVFDHRHAADHPADIVVLICHLFVDGAHRTVFDKRTPAARTQTAVDARGHMANDMHDPLLKN